MSSISFASLCANSTGCTLVLRRSERDLTSPTVRLQVRRTLLRLRRVVLDGASPVAPQARRGATCEAASARTAAPTDTARSPGRGERGGRGCRSPESQWTISATRPQQSTQRGRGASLARSGAVGQRRATQTGGRKSGPSSGASASEARPDRASKSGRAARRHKRREQALPSRSAQREPRKPRRQARPAPRVETARGQTKRSSAIVRTASDHRTDHRTCRGERRGSQRRRRSRSEPLAIRVRGHEQP